MLDGTLSKHMVDLKWDPIKETIKAAGWIPIKTSDNHKWDPKKETIKDAGWNHNKTFD